MMNNMKDPQKFTIELEETGPNKFKYQIIDSEDETVFISDAYNDIFDVFERIEKRIQSKYLDNKSDTII